jgi:sugar lactone lactonase YvrE
LTSDYSAPFALFIGALPVAFSLDGLKVDPRVDQDYVYYSDSPKGVLYRIDAGGEGERFLFANANFKASVKDGREVVQVGLAIDPLGNLYSENAASDAQFGGRVFRFLQPNGAREFSGSLNYFSQLLMFANPVSAGPMAICPNPALFNGDLFVVEEMTRMILRVPVNATYDVNRRVGQPYVSIPPAAGRIIDLTFDKNGNLYLLGMNEMYKVVYDKDTGQVLRTESIAKLRP